MNMKRLHDQKNNVALVKHGTEILIGYLNTPLNICIEVRWLADQNFLNYFQKFTGQARWSKIKKMENIDYDVNEIFVLP